MGVLKINILFVITLSLLNGCAFILEPQSDFEGYVEADNYYVDTYVYIPYEIKVLIADCVYGYSMPPLSRYSTGIYPNYGSDDPYNLPSYVRGDFNGDGYYDYAYMFSRLRWSDGFWYLKTKLLIVTSEWDGYKLFAEFDLGTVSADRDTPVEEYWGIRLLRKGTHTVETCSKRTCEKTSISLSEDGIYLGSVDPQERSVFYIERSVLHEITLDLGAISKKKVSSMQERKDQVITLLN
jgi:hypothetical protein